MNVWGWGRINDLAEECHKIARDHGFWDHEALMYNEGAQCYHTMLNPSIAAEKIALMHSELSEALEALRDGDKENLLEELADTVIRVLDFAGAHKMNIEQAIVNKIEKNRSRPHMHGRRM